MAKKNWIYIKRGLSEDPKHRAAMGESIWLYMHIIDRADWETGIAFDWRDKEEAADMGMELRTLRDQRQKLEKLDYIRCRQKQHGQDISIMEWKNPRDYSSETKNPRIQGDITVSPSDFQDDTQGNTQGNTQVSTQSVTPSLDSKSKSLSEKPAASFEIPLTPSQAMNHPDIQLFEEISDVFPGSRDYEMIIHTMQKLRTKHNGDLKAYLMPFWTAWEKGRTKEGRPFKKTNPAWLTEWAINGEIPSESALTNGPAYKKYVHVEQPKKSTPPPKPESLVKALSKNMSNKKVLRETA